MFEVEVYIGIYNILLYACIIIYKILRFEYDRILRKYRSDELGLELWNVKFQI